MSPRWFPVREQDGFLAFFAGVDQIRQTRSAVRLFEMLSFRTNEQFGDGQKSDDLGLWEIFFLGLRPIFSIRDGGSRLLGLVGCVKGNILVSCIPEQKS